MRNFVGDFADAMMAVDAQRPQAFNARTKEPYQPGIGPHTETKTISLVSSYLITSKADVYHSKLHVEVPYLNARRKSCDVCLGPKEKIEWGIEIKMLRFLGDNGKPNDNMLMHILSPYPKHRSAVTDCEKLLAAGLAENYAVIIYGYDYDEWPMDSAIDAFELLASQNVALGERVTAEMHSLIHPVHSRGRVFGWTVEEKS